MENNKPEKTNKRIYLGKDIDDDSIDKVIDKIFYINFTDDKLESENKDYKREPIELYINTCGGSVYSALALIDIMNTSKTPINTYGVGFIASAGVWVLIHGNKRYLGERSSIMIHGISGFTGGKLEDMRCDISESARLEKLFISDMLKKTNVTKDYLNTIIKMKQDKYLTAKSAISMKIADEIYSK